ncbi:MAG: META domain-containing protein [Dehalococcoidia bacterium]|nr:META domain-containing protein [Dehalococcoidia bacterium]
MKSIITLWALLILVLASVMAACDSDSGKTPSPELSSAVPTTDTSPVTPAQTEADPHMARIAEGYAQALGISVEEAMRRLQLQEVIGELQAKLRANEPETFVELRVEDEPKYWVVVVFTENGEETIKPYIENTELEGIVEVELYDDSPSEPPYPIDTLDGTEWTLTSLNGERLDDTYPIQATFYNGDMMRGHGGCNPHVLHYTAKDGEFIISEEGIVEGVSSGFFDESIIRQGTDYLDTLSSVKAYRVIGNRLELDNTAGETVLRFKLLNQKIPIDPALKSTQWFLKSIRGEDIPEKTYIRLYFHDWKITGWTGCNYYGAKLTQASDGFFSTEGIDMTLMGCSEEEAGQWEAKYQQALMETVGYKIGEGCLNLADADGKVLLSFEQIEELPMNPADLVGTEWKLESVNGIEVGEDLAYILRFLSEIQARGYGKCANFLMTYHATGDNISGGDIVTGTGFQTLDLSESDKEALQHMDDPASWANYRLIGDELHILTIRGNTLIFKSSGAEARTTFDYDAPASQTIDAAIGEPFEACLAITLRLGAKWQESHDRMILSLLSSEYIDDDPLSPGLGGTQCFVFEPIESGTGEITFSRVNGDHFLESRTLVVNIWKCVGTGGAGDTGIDIEQDSGDERAAGLLLKETCVTTTISEGHFLNPVGPEPKEVNPGDPILIVRGLLENENAKRLHVAVWAKGYNKDGELVSWTLDSAHIMGQAQIQLEAHEVGPFTLHLSFSEDVKRIKIYARGYDQPPP